MSDYDVVVVGAGAAGMAAALSSAHCEARVLLVDSEENVGGASRLSAGVVMAAGTRFQRDRGVEDSPDDLYAYYMNFNHWLVDAGVVRALVDNAAPTVEWMVDLGAEIKEIIRAGDEPVPRGHVMVDAGEGIVAALHSAVRADTRIDVALKRRVDRLLLDTKGAVSGVAVGSDEVTAASVILATGGFGANRTLLQEYFPRALGAGEWAWYIGPPSSRGDVFGLCDGLSAQVSGRNRGLVRPRPNFARDLEGAYFPGWLVIVNSLGHRFIDEMAPYSIQEPVFGQQGAATFAIFDAASKRAATPRSTFAHRKVVLDSGTWEDWSESTIDAMVDAGKVQVHGSVDQLAAGLGVPAENLVATVDTYNRFASDGMDASYLKDPTELRPISTPPYYGAEIRLCNISLTACGPRVDHNGQILHKTGRPIEGLYAAGECAGGVLGERYVGSGNSLANALTFGRIAGARAAGQIDRVVGD